MTVEKLSGDSKNCGNIIDKSLPAFFTETQTTLSVMSFEVYLYFTQSLLLILVIYLHVRYALVCLILSYINLKQLSLEITEAQSVLHSISPNIEADSLCFPSDVPVFWVCGAVVRRTRLFTNVFVVQRKHVVVVLKKQFFSDKNKLYAPFRRPFIFIKLN